MGDSLRFLDESFPGRPLANWFLATQVHGVADPRNVQQNGYLWVSNVSPSQEAWIEPMQLFGHRRWSPSLAMLITNARHDECCTFSYDNPGYFLGLHLGCGLFGLFERRGAPAAVRQRASGR